MDASKSAKLYQTKTVEVQQKYGKELLNHIDLQPGCKVGDIGCGCGNLAAEMSKLVGDTGKVIAIDPDVNRIKVAKREYGTLKNVLFSPCKSTQFPVNEEKPYDAFVSNAVLHWIPTDEKRITFRRIMRSLKPGGLFVGNISFNRSINMSLAASLLTEEEQDEITGMYYRENAEILHELLDEAGFETVEFKYRYREVNMGSVDNFLEWITSTYYGKFDFKSAYNRRKENVNFCRHENGDLKHTSEGALFVMKKPE